MPKEIQPKYLHGDYTLKKNAIRAARETLGSSLKDTGLRDSQSRIEYKELRKSKFDNEIPKLIKQRKQSLDGKIGNLVRYSRIGVEHVSVDGKLDTEALSKTEYFKDKKHLIDVLDGYQLSSKSKLRKNVLAASDSGRELVIQETSQPEIKIDEQTAEVTQTRVIVDREEEAQASLGQASLEQKLEAYLQWRGAKEFQLARDGLAGRNNRGLNQSASLDNAQTALAPSEEQQIDSLQTTALADRDGEEQHPETPGSEVIVDGKGEGFSVLYQNQIPKEYDPFAEERENHRARMVDVMIKHRYITQEHWNPDGTLNTEALRETEYFKNKPTLTKDLEGFKLSDPINEDHKTEAGRERPRKKTRAKLTAVAVLALTLLTPKVLHDIANGANKLDPKNTKHPTPIESFQADIQTPPPPIPFFIPPKLENISREETTPEQGFIRRHLKPLTAAAAGIFAFSYLGVMGDRLYEAEAATIKAKWGDTASGLAKRDGISLADFIKANPSIAKNPGKIRAGAKYNLPEHSRKSDMPKTNFQTSEQHEVPLEQLPKEDNISFLRGSRGQSLAELKIEKAKDGKDDKGLVIEVKVKPTVEEKVLQVSRGKVRQFQNIPEYFERGLGVVVISDRSNPANYFAVKARHGIIAFMDGDKTPVTLIVNGEYVEVEAEKIAKIIRENNVIFAGGFSIPDPDNEENTAEIVLLAANRISKSK